MDLARTCPFPVGVVSWSAPEPRRTVIVKATFALDRDGEMLLAHEQRPLDVDRPGASSDELAAASDFVPHKERVDVILVGRAHAETPARAIEASIRIAELCRSFVAIATHPARSIPLTTAHLRSGAASSVPVRVGPIPPRSATRRALAGDHPLDREGAPVGSLSGDFDFGFFNAAPLPQQIEALAPGTEIVLSGLIAGAPQRVLIVPRRRPLVYLVDAAERRAVTIGMRCDTAVIDTDRDELSLTWRGSFDVSGVTESAVLLVAYELVGTRWSTPEVRHQLELASRGRADEPAPPRGRNATLVETPAHLGPATPFVRQEQVAATASVPFPPPAPRDDYHDDVRTQVGGARPAAPALPFAAPARRSAHDDGALPFAAAAPPLRGAHGDEIPTQPNSARVASPALPFGAPAYSDEAPTQAKSGRSSAPALPFSGAPPVSSGLPFTPASNALPFTAAPAPKARSYDGRSTIVFEEGTTQDGAPVLPFPITAAESAPHAPADHGGLPFRVPAPPAPSRDDEITAFTIAPRPSAASLPFVAKPFEPAAAIAPEPPPIDEPEPPTIPPPPAVVPRPPPLVGEVTPGHPAPPPLVGEIAPGHPAPPPPPPLPTMELLRVDAYVAIVAELSQGKRRSTVLAKHGFTLQSWKVQERLQMEAIEKDALHGITARADALAAALDEKGLA